MTAEFKIISNEQNIYEKLIKQLLHKKYRKKDIDNFNNLSPCDQKSYKKGGNNIVCVRNMYDSNNKSNIIEKISMRMSRKPVIYNSINDIHGDISNKQKQKKLYKYEDMMVDSVKNFLLMGHNNIGVKVYNIELLTDGRIAYFFETYTGNLTELIYLLNKKEFYDSIQKKKTEHRLAEVIVQLVKNMVYYNLVCLDIKPGNIVFKLNPNDLTNPTVRLIDFDADFCLNVEQIDITKQLNTTVAYNNEESKRADSHPLIIFLLMLLANHLYTRENYNFLYKYIQSIHIDNNIRERLQTMFNSPLGNSIIKHYFDIPFDEFINNSLKKNDTIKQNIISIFKKKGGKTKNNFKKTKRTKNVKKTKKVKKQKNTRK
jgi:hypothetical protein